MRALKIVCLLFLGGSAFAESKRFSCLVTGGVTGGDTVTVVTQPATVLGKPHQVGTSQIGRWGGSIFSITWDATQPSVSINRMDTDGFEMWVVSSASDGGVILMAAKRPNEPEIRVAGWGVK